MRTLLVCHHDSPLDREGLGGWMASFSDLAGILEIHETRGRLLRRVRREVRRVGALRFADVLAFRLWRRLFLAPTERRWEESVLAALRAKHPLPAGVPVATVGDPNSEEARRFIADARPDLVIARCKTLLREEVFAIPPLGTFVLHPGICPEYRNAHGCFWAMARGEWDRVGMTLLKVDRGVDTGPVFAHLSYPYDPLRESPMVIQQRVVLENLDRIGALLGDVAAGRAVPLDTRGRPSHAWGQPWLSAYLRYRREAGRR